MRTAKLSSKSQIVIPAEVRRRLDLRPGDVLRVSVEGERMVVTKKSELDPLERLKAFGTGRWSEAEEELERGRTESPKQSGKANQLDNQ